MVRRIPHPRLPKLTPPTLPQRVATSACTTVHAVDWLRPIGVYAHDGGLSCRSADSEAMVRDQRHAGAEFAVNLAVPLCPSKALPTLGQDRAYKLHRFDGGDEHRSGSRLACRPNRARPTLGSRSGAPNCTGSRSAYTTVQAVDWLRPQRASANDGGSSCRSQVYGAGVIGKGPLQSAFATIWAVPLGLSKAQPTLGRDRHRAVRAQRWPWTPRDQWSCGQLTCQPGQARPTLGCDPAHRTTHGFNIGHGHRQSVDWRSPRLLTRSGAAGAQSGAGVSIGAWVSSAFTTVKAVDWW